MLNTMSSMVRSMRRRERRAIPSVEVVREGLGLGAGPEWAQTSYGAYYATHNDVYAAVRLRAENVSRPPLVVSRRDSAGQLAPVGREHPAQAFLDRVNPWWTSVDLLRATETYLCLWGSAFWWLDREGGETVKSIWPLRPDRVRIVRDSRRYVAGFRYQGNGQDLAVLPEEMGWFRYFNPLDEFAGLSPLAPARLSADLGADALRWNREFFRNGVTPGRLLFAVQGPLTDDQVEEFYARLERRFKGPERSHRPLVWDLSSGDVKDLGNGRDDAGWLGGMRWSLEAVARTFGVPLPLLEDFSRATYNNAREARRLFWQKTVVPELLFLEAEVNETVLPNLGMETQGLEVHFDLTKVEALAEDEGERAKRFQVYLDRGVMTPNEVRAQLGLEPVPWGDAWWASRGARRVGERE